MATVELERVRRRDGNTLVLDDVSFEVGDGELVGLIGPSGSGKTSIIRAIAGFDALTSGTIRFDGNDVTEMPTSERDLGLISQHNSLFPTHRVRDNLRFPLLRRALSRSDVDKRVAAESRALNIDHILDRWPDSLSGGEQQLAQIARALVRVPKVFLMDEPLSQLDARIRRHLREEIVTLQRGYGVTMIYASNRPEEIMTMPDRLIALDGGRVVQVGAPAEVRARPATLALAELTGPIGRLQVTVEVDDVGLQLVADALAVRAWAPHLADYVGHQLTLGARPQDVRVASAGSISMTVGAPTIVASTQASNLHAPGGTLRTLDMGLTEGEVVRVALDSWVLFDNAGQRVHSFPI